LIGRDISAGLAQYTKLAQCSTGDPESPLENPKEEKCSKDMGLSVDRV